jgi:hypothetical protein
VTVDVTDALNDGAVISPFLSVQGSLKCLAPMRRTGVTDLELGGPGQLAVGLAARNSLSSSMSRTMTLPIAALPSALMAVFSPGPDNGADRAAVLSPPPLFRLPANISRGSMALSPQLFPSVRWTMFASALRACILLATVDLLVHGAGDLIVVIAADWSGIRQKLNRVRSSSEKTTLLPRSASNSSFDASRH